MLRLRLRISLRRVNSMRVYLSVYFCSKLRLDWRQSHGCSRCVAYRSNFSRIKAGIPFCVCKSVWLCYNLYKWSELMGHRSGSPSLWHKAQGHHLHGGSSTSVCQLLSMASLATGEYQQRSLPPIGRLPSNAHTALANAGCAVPNVSEVWNWAQMLNKAVGTRRLCVCGCVWVCVYRFLAQGCSCQTWNPCIGQPCFHSINVCSKSMYNHSPKHIHRITRDQCVKKLSSPFPITCTLSHTHTHIWIQYIQYIISGLVLHP